MTPFCLQYRHPGKTRILISILEYPGSASCVHVQCVVRACSLKAEAGTALTTATKPPKTKRRGAATQNEREESQERPRPKGQNSPNPQGPPPSTRPNVGRLYWNTGCTESSPYSSLAAMPCCPDVIHIGFVHLVQDPMFS